MDNWSHLPTPFRPGTVIPSNRDRLGWHFTFSDATGNSYHNRTIDYRSAAEAKSNMRSFVARYNRAQLKDSTHD